MIIRIKYTRKKSSKLADLVGNATILKPIDTLTKHVLYSKVIVDEGDNADEIRQSLTANGFTVADLQPRITIEQSPDAARQRELASNFYFIASGDRGSFIFTNKAFFDEKGRIDGSFLGDEQLEAALPAGFSNFGEPEWYKGDCEVNDQAWIDAYNELLAAGFSELAYSLDSEKYEPKDSAAVREAAARFYFIAATKYESPTFFFIPKDHWDEHGQTDDCFDGEDPEFELAKPLGFLYESEAEYEYRDSKENKRDFKIGRRLLLAAGFIELPDSEIP